ncbi:hypothetical protein GOBAR_AA13203 [Gossypium barbadense]|uniref:Uncharacterized protein n=1 Tax=Gossypium barbadense TaxID=3634 RepID=A0A2P5XVQ9_GOSBA|nr:hypothetical protein GOBAR_AA13203 [Gossypium barbadense]
MAEMVEGRRYGRWYGTPVSDVVHVEASTWRQRRNGMAEMVEGRRYGRWYGTPVSDVVHVEASTWRQRRNG